MMEDITLEERLNFFRAKYMVIPSIVSMGLHTHMILQP